MNHTIYKTATGETKRRNHRRKGRKPQGMTKLLIRLPTAHVEAMRWENERCGGQMSVNEQIRDAVRGMLCGLVYTQLFKP